MAPQRSSTLVLAVVVVTLLTADLATATSRSVNISSVWFLPQEGFPVFYRYFKDRITWFEADAVCQFHHANLVTVDTSVQYDATRAYLKELDIATNVWIGLKRASATDDFAWTDYKKMDPAGGYWQEQIPKTATPLCAASDPAADFRWHSFNCGGPEVASFICELPVPTWARKEDGCLLTSLPSLTVVFLPEQGAVELASDCGLDGTRRIACKGQANREEMMRQLSCDRGATSPDDATESMSTEVTSSSTGTTGVRGLTGHSHEPPTRHRRDTDLLTSSVTTAVSEETSSSTRHDSDQLPSTGTVASTEVSVDSSTVTTVKEETTTVLADELTTEKKTTNQEPQLSTESASSTPTMTEEVTLSSTSPDPSTTTLSLGDGFIEVRELEIIAENITDRYVFEAEPTSRPHTTVRSESPVESTKIDNFGSPAEPIKMGNFGSPVEPNKVVNIGSLVESTSMNNFGSPVEINKTDNFGSTVEPTKINNFGPPVESTKIDNFGSPVEPTKIENFGAPAESTKIDYFGAPVESTKIDYFGAPVEPTKINNFGAPVEPTKIDNFGLPVEPTKTANYELLAESAKMANIETLAVPTKTANYESPAQSAKMANYKSPSEPTVTSNLNQTDSVATILTTEVLGNEGSPASVVKVTSHDKNVSSERQNVDSTSTTDQPVSVATSTSNTTTTADYMGEPREEAMSNYTINSDSHKSDEIKSREEAEEELLKEAERKEEERKFKEEEETRRRQFLPSPLRSLPDTKTSSPPPVLEEYEEPEEVMEPEPEVPARPNRGRRLTRPQPHSFYPYFLNRVLG